MRRHVLALAATVALSFSPAISAPTPPPSSGSGITSLTGGVTATGPGAAAATVIGPVNKVTVTAPATSATLTIADGKTLTSSNTLTLAGTDASTLNVGTGGTLGTAAFVNTGTSAGTVPLLNASTLWSGATNTFSNGITISSGANVNLAANTNLNFNSVGRFGNIGDGQFYMQNNAASQVIRITAAFTSGIQLGAADAAAPVAQILGVQNVVTGTTDTSGALWTFKDSNGTGTGGSGGYSWFTAAASTTGSTPLTQTSKMTLSNAGVLAVTGAITSGSSITAGATGNINWTGRAVTTSPAAATFQFGGAAAASPVAQTVQFQPVVTGTSNTAGTDATFKASQGTGTGGGGALIFQTAPATGSGSTPNAEVTAFKIDSAGVLTNPTIGTDAGLTDTAVCQDTTNHAFKSGSGAAGICLGTSSVRFKHDIAPLTAGLSEIMRLQPVSYKLNADHGDPNKILYGFTAEQMLPILPKLVGLNDKGQPNTADYVGLIPVLVKAVQQQQAEIEALKKQVANDNIVMGRFNVGPNCDPKWSRPGICADIGMAPTTPLAAR